MSFHFLFEILNDLGETVKKTFEAKPKMFFTVLIIEEFQREMENSRVLLRRLYFIP